MRSLDSPSQLRDYQATAISAIQADWHAGILDVLMAHPTGLGKTVTAAHLLRDEMTRNPNSRAIFVAHRDELIVQPQERFGRWWPESMLFSGVVKAGRNEVNARLIFASIQTVSRPNRLQQLVASGPFDYLVYDECLPHNALVLLASGETRSIGEIVDTLDKPEVVCYSKGMLTTRPVVKGWKLEPKAPLVRVVHEQGEIICTGNHRLLTQKGWVPAGLLEGNIDHVFALREEVQEPSCANKAPEVQLRKTTLPILREGTEEREVPGSPHQARTYGLPVQALQLRSTHPREYEQSSVGRTPRMDARTPIGAGYTRVPAEALGDQAGEEESNVWGEGYRCVRPSMVDSREARGATPTSTVPMARPGVCTSPDEWPEATPHGTGDSLLGNAASEGTGHDSLHRGLQLCAQGQRALEEPRLYSARAEKGHRAVRRVLPRPGGDTPADEILPGLGMGGADYLGRGGEKQARRSGRLDCGVPGPSLVLSVKVLPEQEQWVYDLTVAEVHNFVADGIVVSNCHHSITETGQRFIDGLREANPGLKHLGMSATPWRADGIGMITVYEKISDQRNIRWAIKNGWLVPVEGLQVETGVDISSVPLYRGDFATGTLGDVLDAASWHELVADAYLEHAQGKQTIAFTPRVSNSLNLCNALVERGVSAAHVDATTPREERRAIMSKFRNSEIQVLCNVGIVSEGFDAPSANCIMLARPTKSHGWFTQAIGRGLRIYPGKEKCLVLLFMTTGAHILTLHDLGESKKLKEVKEKDELLAIEGVSSPIPLFDDMAFDGVGLYAKTVDLFGSSKGAWFRDGATFSLALGESGGYDRTLVILPPNNGDNWRLMGLGRKLTSEGAWADKRKAKYGPWSHKVLEESPDVEDLMIMATGIIERVGADIISLRNKKWRDDPVSAGQLRYARKWVSAEILEPLKKGKVAQLITHHVACDHLRKEGLL